MTTPPVDADVVVVGAGITGLAAAWEAHRRGASVVVLEAAPRAGGKIHTSTVGDLALDEAADAFLVRVPEAVTLCRELGIEAELVAPATGSAYVWVDGALRPLPREQLLGVPTDLDVVGETGVLTAEGLARARQDLTAPDDRPAGDADESVANLVRRRLGDEVLDRLVAPLVGGIWAGDCEQLSLAVATPNLAEARRRDRSLVRAAAEIRAAAAERPVLLAGSGAGAPDPANRTVFLAPRGGMGRLVDVLAEQLGDAVVTGAPVTAIEPAGRHAARRWRVGPFGTRGCSSVG